MNRNGLLALVEDLIEGGFVLASRPLIRRDLGREEELELGRTGPLDGDPLYAEGSIHHYLETLRQDRISLLLFDGSILQILFRVKGGAISFHRYAYIPAPFDLDLSSETETSVEFVEAACALDPFGTAGRGIVRFEFDPDVQTHALAHVHINTPSCRLPMRAPINAREFCAFLVEHFYPDRFTRELCGRLSFAGDSSLAPEEEQRFHPNWRRVRS